MFTLSLESLCPRELACYILFLGGSVREYVLNQGLGTHMSPADRKELARGRGLLLRAMQPECVFRAASGQLLSYPFLSVSTIEKTIEARPPLQAGAGAGRGNDKGRGKSDLAYDEDCAEFYQSAYATFKAAAQLASNSEGHRRKYEYATCALLNSMNCSGGARKLD